MVDIEKLMQENDNFVFDLYGTLIDIHTDEWADETWEKFCAFLDEEGITHPEITLINPEPLCLETAKQTITTEP